MLFHNKVEYDHNFGGFGSSSEEGERLRRVLGDKEILLMGNHGLLTTGTSIARALYSLYIFERCCMFQVCKLTCQTRHAHGHNK